MKYLAAIVALLVLDATPAVKAARCTAFYPYAVGAYCCDAETNPSVCSTRGYPNPTCEDLSNNGGLGVDGSDSFKIDCDAPDGTYDLITDTQEGCSTEVVGALPEITMDVDKTGFGTLTQSLVPDDGIQAVIMQAKGTKRAILYFGDAITSELATPVAKNGKNYDTGHVEWCYSESAVQATEVAATESDAPEVEASTEAPEYDDAEEVEAATVPPATVVDETDPSTEMPEEEPTASDAEEEILFDDETPCTGDLPIRVETTMFGRICCDAPIDPTACRIDGEQPLCADLQADAYFESVVTSDSFTIDCDVPEGAYSCESRRPQHQCSTEVQGTAPPKNVDIGRPGIGLLTQTLTTQDGIGGVIVKGGNGAIVYFGDAITAEMKTPENDYTGGNYHIDNVEWCYDPSSDEDPFATPTPPEDLDTEAPEPEPTDTEAPEPEPTEPPYILETTPPDRAPPVFGGNGGAFGDPHVETWTGEHYEYHGACDLVLVQNPGFANGLGMDIHMRTMKVKSWSYIDSAVLRIGGDTLEVKGGDDTRSYWINGVHGREKPGPGEVGNGLLPETLGGYPIVYRRLRGDRRRFIVDLGNGEEVIFKTFKYFVRVNVQALKVENFATAVGLMGTYPNGLKLGRDNSTMMEDLNVFGQEWQVRADEPMLFRNIQGPQPPMQCAVPTAESRRLSESSITMEDAKTACADVRDEDRESCIFDVLATEDMDMAGAY